MNIIETARENFIAASRHCYFSPTCPTFTRPNAKCGYGAVLKLLSNGSMPSRTAILKRLSLPSRNGYYARVFQSLLWSKLICHANGCYALTQLGRDYVAENLNGSIANSHSSSSTDDGNDDGADGTEPAWKKTYDAAMEAYKAAMEAYQAAISAFA